MRLLFIVLLILHGSIHLLGFIKSFWFTEVNKQALGISKPIGAIWLITFILFIVVAAGVFKNKKWFYIAFAAIIISQVLIILAWNDAKFGTIVNVLIFLISLSNYSVYRFDTMVESEVQQMLKTKVEVPSRVIAKSDIENLPAIVQQWLIKSGVIGKPIPKQILIQQRGQMRTKPRSKWMNFEAKQHFNLEDPSFIWSAKAKMGSELYLYGRDKLYKGKGFMLIKLSGLISMVNEADNPQINQGTMLRFLSEISWFPQAALHDYITWEVLDEVSAKATFNYNNTSVSGIFLFSDEGDLKSFKAERYRGSGTEAKLETWVIKVLSYTNFNGVSIPNKSKVIWKLNTGDFHWLIVEVVDVTHTKL